MVVENVKSRAPTTQLPIYFSSESWYPLKILRNFLYEEYYSQDFTTLELKIVADIIIPIEQVTFHLETQYCNHINSDPAYI